MNKKLAAVLAATCVLGATTAFAANPFSDVTPNDWAYQAVAQLAAEGVIDGYPDGTFQGERNITRYEMAQMVARAMARQDMVDAQQQAQINRLADEFANELNSLGVRVTNLENRLGNVKLTGDARVRWMNTYDLAASGGVGKLETKDNFDMRVRVVADAKVGEKTNVHARLTSGSFGFDSGKDAGVELDQLWAEHDFNGFGLKAGRYNLTLGATGVFYDSTFDGVQASFGDKVRLVGGFGYMKDTLVDQDQNQDLAKGLVKDIVKKGMPNHDHDDEIDAGSVTLPDFKSWYVQLEGDAAKDLTLKAFYLHPEIKASVQYDDGGQQATGTWEYKNKFWGAGFDWALNDQFGLHGDYVRGTENNLYNKKPELWTAGVVFGGADTAKVGSFEIGADYVRANQGSYYGGTALDLDQNLAFSVAAERLSFWQVSAAVVPFENTKLNTFWQFKGEATINGKTEKGKDVYGVELNYYF